MLDFMTAKSLGRNTKIPGRVSRRQFLVLSAAGAGAVAAGCATNPVTGRRQLMLISEAEEIDLDRRWAPHQFSADYGAVQDASLNAYVGKMGADIAAVSYRPHMPYNFRVLNAVVVNGYTFPAGSVGLNRGLLVNLKTEAELAAVIGHEVGHVNYRHAGAQMSSGMLVQLAVAGLTAVVASKNEKYAWLAAGLGGIGGAMLLCRYSREDEREADEVGMANMVKAGYNPAGMAGVMECFLRLQKEKPNAVDLLFATHPMSNERYKTAMANMQARYADKTGLPDYRERYMDHIAPLRAMKEALDLMEKGGTCMGGEKYAEAEKHFAGALRLAPDDYAGLLMTAKCCLIQKKNGEAERYAAHAKAVYPQEPQALHICGMARMEQAKFDAALQDFTQYESKLPGNPNTVYYKGLCLEKMGRREPAAREYQSYLKDAPDGEFAEYVQKRLTEWGYKTAK